MTHVEYDLLVTNVFTAPVTLEGMTKWGRSGGEWGIVGGLVLK
jgi:hypothetical protein